MVPSMVRSLTPSEVASILGLDRQLAVLAAARPLLDGGFVDLQAGDAGRENLWTPPSSGQNEDPPVPRQRIRGIM
jgi:hypothetical protein